MDAPWTFGPAAVASFVVFVGILIFVHELGHFVAAKFFNIKVLKFSLGFGPALISFRRGETLYQIAALPLGGFVKMVGDNPVDDVLPEDRTRSFSGAPIHQRAIIASAGPVSNLVFPVLCFFAYNVLGPTIIAPVLGQIEIASPAERAGLRSGDRVLSVDDVRVWSFERMSSLIRKRPGESLKVTVQREGSKPLNLEVVPAPVEGRDPFGGGQTIGMIGVTNMWLGTRIGVADPAKNRARFVTGDEILKVGGDTVQRMGELDLAIRKNAGRLVPVVIARASPKKAGGLLYARDERPVVLEVEVPVDAQAISDLGLAPAECFVHLLVPGGAAERSGLRPGDRVLAVDGKEVSFFGNFVAALVRAEDEPVHVRVLRQGHELDLTLKNESVERIHEITGQETRMVDPGLGLGELPRPEETILWPSTVPPETERATLSLVEAFTVSVEETVEVIAIVALGIYKVFAREISVKTVGGPILLFQIAAQAAEAGVFMYLQTLALISVNLGLINLLPIPVFDGGHLLFCAVEAVKRKPVSLRVREAASIIGLVLLAALIVLAITNDISRL